MTQPPTNKTERAEARSIRPTRPRTTPIEGEGIKKGGEGGIRTHQALPPTRFPGERPRPLGDLSLWPVDEPDCRKALAPSAKRLWYYPTCPAKPPARASHTLAATPEGDADGCAL